MTNSTQNEIVYSKFGNRNSRSEIQCYHGSDRADEKHKGGKSKDVQMIPKRVLEKNIKFNNFLDQFESKFTIGMEVEKNRFAVDIEELVGFKGFETDSSCGYEFITDILPLLPPSLWRNKIFNMLHQAKRFIEDEYSPSYLRKEKSVCRYSGYVSNFYKCGGHITLGCDGMSGRELQMRFRRVSGLLMAMFEKRLQNSYCSNNILMMPTEPTGNQWNPARQIADVDYSPLQNHPHTWIRRIENETERNRLLAMKRMSSTKRNTSLSYYRKNGDGSSRTFTCEYFQSKFQFCLDKGKVIEFRVVSRFQSVKQTMRRYELFYTLMDLVVNTPMDKKISFNKLHKATRKIVKGMYENELDAKLVFAKSKHYQAYLDSNGKRFQTI